ncbi:hypothetical protein DI09_131p30 [Mitosporidium daphniae]|uniref:Uncharacterized protein n=1 Tax=Mitosporidium daphniae TaxID=1485682 RepID=A0A098VVD9_9MICR|nr:uncharacterized protein DI09_131p30 [Mitosporidium daphniae]KGG52819.1 hypothetical protein DI09_131p30 [Mitosporidium daphniae]|eukprot:XP_013239255.1 uncharacterized protein DI09_131p30 [Mitosporidium daphniae]
MDEIIPAECACSCLIVVFEGLAFFLTANTFPRCFGNGSFASPNFHVFEPGWITMTLSEGRGGDDTDGKAVWWSPSPSSSKGAATSGANPVPDFHS